jgi:hypothetical protein
MKTMQSILYNNKLIYNLSLLNKEVCNGELRLDNLLNHYIKNDHYYTLSREQLRKEYKIEIKAPLVTFGDEEICFEILTNKKSKYRGAVIRNVMSVLEGSNTYFTPLTNYVNEPESPDEQSETISNENEPSSIVSSNEGDLAMKEYGICCSACNKQT